MEFSYYGRMNNGVHIMMIEEYVNKNIEKLEQRLTSVIQEGLAHLRKDTLSQIKNIKSDLEILFKVDANKEKKKEVEKQKAEKEKQDKIDKKKAKVNHSSKPEPKHFEDNDDFE